MNTLSPSVRWQSHHSDMYSSEVMVKVTGRITRYKRQRQCDPNVTSWLANTRGTEGKERLLNTAISSHLALSYLMVEGVK